MTRFPGVPSTPASGLHALIGSGVGTGSPYSYGSKIYAVPLSGANTQYDRFATFGVSGANNSVSGEVMNGISYWSTHHNSLINGIAANSSNQRTPLWPNIIRLLNQNNNQWRISGHTPLIKFCFMDYLQPGDIIFDDWQVFPISQYLGDNSQAPTSYKLGIAYKRT